MTLLRLIVVAASCALAFSTYAADGKEAPGGEAAKTEPAEKAAEKAAEPKRVIEISRSTKVDCDIKPVMTDEEIARCRQARRR